MQLSHECCLVLAHICLVLHVVFKHAFATKRDLAEFNDRINMAKLNFESVAANVKVLRLEEEVVTEALNKAMAEGPKPDCPRG